MNHIYFINTCDAWKSYDSMRPAFIGTSKKMAYKKLIQMIKDEEVNFYDEEFTVEQQLTAFKTIWNAQPDNINNHLIYGFYEVLENNCMDL